MESAKRIPTNRTAAAQGGPPTGAAPDGGTGTEWRGDESGPSHTKIAEGGQGVVQGGALDPGVVEIRGQADDGAAGRSGGVESAGSVGDTVPASGGLITGVEGEGAGEAILVSNPGLVGATSLGPEEREKGACRRRGEVSGVVSSVARVPLQKAVAKEEFNDALTCVPPHVELYMQDKNGTHHNREILMELLREDIAYYCR